MLSINPKDYKAGGGIAAGVFAIGIPASLNSVLMSTSHILVNKLMQAHGDMALAGLGVAMKVNMIAIMLLIGLGTGVQPLLGYCFGAKDKKRYFEVLKFSLMCAFVLSMVMTAICYLGAKPLVNAFLEDAEALNFGMSFSRILIYSGPVIGILFVMINAIQSIGAAVPSLILSLSRQGILYIPILFIFNSFETEKMLAFAQPVTDYLAATFSVILFVSVYKKYFNKKSL